MTTVAGDSFQSAPTEPLLPASWTRQSSEGADGHGQS
ncbi:hypothetical protein [Mycolicibacter arupensis]